jgi:hypothetical protein
MCTAECEKTGKQLGVYLVQDEPGEIGAYKETGRQYSNDDIKPGQSTDKLEKYTLIYIESSKPEGVRQLIEILISYEKDLLAQQQEATNEKV